MLKSGERNFRPHPELLQIDHQPYSKTDHLSTSFDLNAGDLVDRSPTCAYNVLGERINFIMDKFDDGWILFEVVNDETEAHLIFGLLQGEGIKCRMQSMRVPQYPLTVDGLGEIRILVTEKELTEARRIVAASTNRPME